jgi:membrane protein DedA with SNARE-associated domain
MEQILRLIEHYGYLVVFFGVMLESTGVPLPGETILLASGFLAQRGHLDVGDAILLLARILLKGTACEVGVLSRRLACLHLVGHCSTSL